MSLKIIAVGDIMLGDQNLCAGFGVGSKIKKNGPEYLFKDVKEILKQGDIVFGNFECSIYRGIDKESHPFFCAPESAIDELQSAGFTALSVANNHIMENGRKIFDDTVVALREVNIQPIGLKNNITVIHINDKKIALLGYSFVEEYISDSGYNKLISDGQIIDDINKVRGDVDLIILSIHWEPEYVPYPSYDQVKMARRLIDAGADVILGGHPHVLQSYEIYKGKPIIYSLGNFVFDQTFNPITRNSAIFVIEIGTEAQINYLPISLDMKNYSPKISTGKDREIVIEMTEKIHNILQDVSLDEYKKMVISYTTEDNPYHRKIKKYQKLQFIKNIWRYDVGFTMKTLIQYLK